jgi:hypothetical protein
MSETQDEMIFEMELDSSDEDELREGLRETIARFAGANDVSHAMLAPLLLDLAVDSCALEYLYNTRKPSAAGLKRVFDRFQRDAENFFQASKKDADVFITSFKVACMMANMMEPEPGKDAA